MRTPARAGVRRTRRFLHSERCSTLFAWVDSLSDEGSPEPGTYRLVAPHPRRVVERDGGATLGDVGLVGRQELLFAERVGAGN